MSPAMRQLILFSLLLAAMAAALPAQKAGDESARAAQEDDIRETVFRYQFKNAEISAAYHFIAFEDKSPPETFLRRFKDDDPPVRPLSDARIEKKPIRTVVNKKDEQGGIIFHVGQIKWISDVKADIQGSYDCGDNCEGASGIYHATKQDGRWAVDSFENSKKPSS
jgi:hypothetical protein